MNLITGFYTLYLALVSSRADIDIEKFARKARELEDAWKEFFPWFPWSVSIHRISRHAPEMMKKLPKTLKPSDMDEEPGEHCNKYTRTFQTDHSRQIGLQERNLGKYLLFFLFCLSFSL